jgi:hypothetical protein
VLLLYRCALAARRVLRDRAEDETLRAVVAIMRAEYATSVAIVARVDASNRDHAAGQVQAVLALADEIGAAVSGDATGEE